MAHTYTTYDPKCKATSVYTSVDIANRFRDSLKPAFKLLVARINEITESVDSIDEANSALQIDINEQLANYISKNDLVRSDTVDGFAKVDQENNKILYEFEDNIADGLLVFRTFANNNTISRQRRFYVNVANGSIAEYKGVQTDVEIEGIPVKGLANSETDRTTYMPNAELSDKVIYISYDPNYALTGVIIEHNTFTRQLVFTSNDLAYMCDIYALHKKIDYLAEQSHINDTAIMSIQEDYAMIDEVNEALKNYVLKSEMPPTVDLEAYRRKNDLLSYTDTTCTKEATFEKSGDTYNIYLSYVEGTHFDIKYEENTYSFVFTIDEQKKQGSKDIYDHNISDSLKFKWLSRSSGSSGLFLLDSNNLILGYELLSVTYPGPDELALRSQIEELKAENAELRDQIAALQPVYPWSSFYVDFTERLEFYKNACVSKNFNYTYNSVNGSLIIVMTTATDAKKKEYLLIFIDDALELHYFRWDITNKVVHYNEIKNSTITSAVNSHRLTILSGIKRHFAYVFTKPA